MNPPNSPRYGTFRFPGFGLALFLAALGARPVSAADLQAAYPHWSGVYPHLAFFNDENECGTGAVVVWAGRLWVVTYAPHAPSGSTDKLYEITPGLELIKRPESIGGTPANRMIHRESGQLFIGPYAINQERVVRAIPYDQMYGRPTGNARHLTHPAQKIYYATMEEGIYEVNVDTLAVKELFRDEQVAGGRKADLPGYHGKGLYSGQGRLVYANNGEHGPEARRRPDIPSGVLAEWDGKSSEWTIVRRNQFTEVTGPGGIYGSSKPETDPIWSIGWDHRSLLLMVLDAGEWHAFRLPKASHSYDGAHGWNTEWPRIRDIGEEDLLMTMHGMWWRFPRDFGPGQSAGLTPRSTYLKVIGDFCRWEDRVVFGCDDTAKNEFLNKRKAKGSIAAPRSQSNLWFVSPEQLDHFGPVLGRGAVWLEEDVPASTPSDPFLISGFRRQALHLSHAGTKRAVVSVEIDAQGYGEWEPYGEYLIEANDYRWVPLSTEAPWIRLASPRDLTRATAWLELSNPDSRTLVSDPMFDGMARADQPQATGGIIRARGAAENSLHVAAYQTGPDGPIDLGYYELGEDMTLRPVKDVAAHEWLKKNAAIPQEVLQHDSASAIFINDDGRRFRLPRTSQAYENPGPLGAERVAREISTERDLFNCHGLFYELPAENAGGFSKIRPIASHNLRIKDFCSYRGLLVLSGIGSPINTKNSHIIRSDDGLTALWVGVADDLWKLGKPMGTGGPWKRHRVTAGEYSDPYLMTGFDRKILDLQSSEETKIDLEIDLDGTGLWKHFRSFSMKPEQTVTYEFPVGFQAYWVRFKSSEDSRLTAQLTYE